jgi:hypothetical protein
VRPTRQPVFCLLHAGLRGSLADDLGVISSSQAA